MKTGIKYSILILVVIAAGAVFYNRVYLPKSTFQTVGVSRGDIAVTVTGVGTLSAKNIYTVGAQVSGTIVSIATDEGAWIEEGALIATLDPVDMPLQLQEAKLAVTKATYEQQAVQKERESLAAQKELAAATYMRYERLFKQGYVAQVEYDKAASDLQSITAQIAATEARIASSKQEVARMKKSVDSLQMRLSQFHLYAPISGYVVSKDAEVAQNVTPAHPIVTIVNPDSVWVEAYIDERISGAVALKQPCLITLRSQNKTPLKGYVARISAMSDAVTQEREVNIFFKKTPIPFYMNEQAEVSIVTHRLSDVLRVPLSAVRRHNTEEGVWIVRKQRAHFVALDITARGKEYGAFSSGLAEGDRIIVPDPSKKPLSEGMKVYQ